jgi:hypothetical protein
MTLEYGTEPVDKPKYYVNTYVYSTAKLPQDPQLHHLESYSKVKPKSLARSLIGKKATSQTLL